MSDEYYFKTKGQEAIGTISGWDVITTAESENSTHIPSSDHEYTLPDLYLQLKKLMSRLDPEHIEYLIKSVQTHVNDKDNPHQTSLDKMATNVVKELYHLWISEGYEGSEDVFLKNIFQYVEIADLETTLKGQALDQVPSVYTVSKTIEEHNLSVDAHENLITSMFPGTPLASPPTYAILGLVSQAKVPDAVEVERTGTIWINNSFGVLKEVAPNTILPDWVFGDPALPIFSSYTQYIEYPEDITKYSKTNVIVERSTNTYSPRVNDEFAYFVKESQDASAKEHCLSCSLNVEVDTTYTFSVFVKPLNRDAFILDLNNFVKTNKYNTIGYNFKTKSVFIRDNADKTRITGGMSELPSGWFRVWATFKPSLDTTNNIKLILADIHDGDTTYQGNGLAGLHIFGLQLTNTNTVAPYVINKSTIGATKLKLPLDSEWFNKDESTFIMEVSNISPLVQDSNCNIFTTGNNTIRSIEVRFPTNHANRPYFSVFNTSGTAIKNRWGTVNTSDRALVALAYDNTGITYGYLNGDPVTDSNTVKINDTPTYLYIGSRIYGDEQLNGYMFRFEYYPFKCTEDNLKYFLEDPINVIRNS